MCIRDSYKSVVDVFDRNGKEIFKTNLRTARVVDVSISQDSKYLAIAEVDLSGIIIKSIKETDLRRIFVMAKRGGFPGGMMPGNMNNLMKQAQKMQKQMEETTKNLEDKVYESSVGGGVVTAKVSGKKELMEIKLDSEVVDPDDIETLEDLIISAVNEALRAQEEDYNNNMSKISGGMGLGGLPF